VGRPGEESTSCSRNRFFDLFQFFQQFDPSRSRPHIWGRGKSSFESGIEGQFLREAEG